MKGEGPMRKALLFVGSGIGLAMILTAMMAIQPLAAPQEGEQVWKRNDRSRPEPAIITPGTFSTPKQAGAPPSDATILFDGKDLSKWEMSRDGSAPLWPVKKGYFEVIPKHGPMRTKDSFGDCQLHVEWASPNPPVGKDQDRGNSGVFLNGIYEIQVLDSYDNVTYADGEAAALYGEYPPLVNACRKPGEWQTYDIVFHAPHFDASGTLQRPGTVTVFFNGVLVLDHVEIKGPTARPEKPPYKPRPDKGPLELQDHNHPVRYRNIWLRELPPDDNAYRVVLK
jgi:hypothetical protein